MPREDCNSVPGVSNRFASPLTVVIGHGVFAVTALTLVVLAMLGVGPS
jgi:hypothetical protein